MNVIESDDYRDEERVLKADPIIVRMAEEMRGAPYPLEGWSFVQAASDTYRHRGGTQAMSIGGPARAVKALLER